MVAVLVETKDNKAFIISTKFQSDIESLMTKLGYGSRDYTLSETFVMDDLDTANFLIDRGYKLDLYDINFRGRSRTS